MATQSIVLNDTEWTRITAAGESGTCWKKDGQHIVVDHTDQETADTLPLSNVNVALDKSKRVPLDQDNDNVLTLPADNSSDIFYARAVDSESGIIAVDVV